METEKEESDRLIKEEEIQDLLYSIRDAEFAITDYKAQLKALGYKEESRIAVSSEPKKENP